MSEQRDFALYDAVDMIRGWAVHLASSACAEEMPGFRIAHVGKAQQ